MPTSPRERPYHHGDLRRSLIETGEVVLAERGVSGLSLREVARRLGVSHNAPYKHFPTREALLAAIAAAGFDEFAERARAASAQVEPTRAAVARGLAYVRFALERPAVFRLMFSSEIDRNAFPDMQASSEASLAGAVRSITEAYGETFAAEATLGAWSAVHGLAELLLADQIPEAFRAGRTDLELAEAVLEGLSQAIGRSPDQP